MSIDAPRLYDVTVSGQVADRVRALAVEARNRGDGTAFLAALQEFYYRLTVDPPFGDLLSDLRQEVGQLRIGIVPPLVMRYGVYEERRQVFVGALPVLLRRRDAG